MALGKSSQALSENMEERRVIKEEGKPNFTMQQKFT